MHDHSFIYLDRNNISESRLIQMNETNEIRKDITLSDYQKEENSLSLIDPIVIVPADDVILMETTLPKGKSHEMSIAAAYALEDQLIDDVDTLHFALGSIDSNNNTAIAIINKETLESWLNQLATYHIYPSMMIPEQLTIPFIENNWHVAITSNNATIRTKQQIGLRTNIENLDTLLSITLNESDQTPQKIIVDIYDDKQYESFLSEFPIEHSVTYFNPHQYITDLIRGISLNQTINLLQGKYRPKKANTILKKRTFILGGVLIFLFFVLFISRIGLLIKLNHSNNVIQKKINAIYFRHFPNATTIVAPDERLMKKLKTLERSSQRNSFLIYLAKISTTLNFYKIISIEQIEFNDNIFILTIQSDSFSQIQLFISALKKQSLIVKQKQAGNKGARVEAILEIRGTSI